MNRELAPIDQEKMEEAVHIQPLLNYLQSSQGHEIASRVLSVIEDVKKATLEKTTAHALFEKWLQTSIIVIVVLASAILSYLDKFDTSLGVLFGTLVGYIFGKK